MLLSGLSGVVWRSRRKKKRSSSSQDPSDGASAGGGRKRRRRSSQRDDDEDDGGGEKAEEEDRGFFFLLSGGKSAQREYIAQIKGVDGELAQAGAEPAQRAEVSVHPRPVGVLPVWSSVWLLLLASA